MTESLTCADLAALMGIPDQCCTACHEDAANYGDSLTVVQADVRAYIVCCQMSRKWTEETGT